MKKVNILRKITESGVVAIVRTESKEEAIKVFDALIHGGIGTIELSLTTPDAIEAIKELTDRYAKNSDVVIGAGTVLDSETARISILNGAKYIVSPSFDKQTAKLCNLYQVPYLPGCMTVTEMQTALQYGVDIIKLFPGNMYKPEFVQAVKAPLPQVNIMPTGGVTIDNLELWFKAGCVVVGVGGNLTSVAQNGDYENITEKARKYVERIKEVRLGMNIS
ncbi:bifunctional 2-keto-4-hydroxyglutarate aldolase/2-keto-3-deoxy-6-phosphogluconate aldolase [Neobacillus sp. LXY-4]|uniref:bifunctional 2-keto-4-hydroxyglutarate aldolase/2-keto-3-deoxy-6-phosphogluconate aldolase n=1 Tax=Neobacillus sp. LXY-4 TaxID=3379826 RepID=UPI003EDFAF3E